MSKIIIVFIIALMGMSCVSTPTAQPAPYALTDINEWIYYNIKYDNVARTTDTVQAPDVTLSKMSGSCLDMSVLFIEMSDSAVELFGVVIDGSKYHMMVVSKTLGYYDPTHGKAYGWELPKGWVKYNGKY
jgi:hypothetical protein